MALLINCPVCGPRNGYEFRFGGEDKGPPPRDEDMTEAADWCEFVHMNKSGRGVHKEWWYHRDGCGTWFTIYRDNTSNKQILDLGKNDE